MEIYSEKYDFKKFKGAPKKIVCVYFVPRSGSTMLATAMRETEKLGFPLEYFSAHNMSVMRKRMPTVSRSNVKPLFEKRTSKNGVFSFKWNSNYGPLTIIKPDFSVFIDRYDIKAQAASYVTASKSGRWADNDIGKYNATLAEISDAAKMLESVRTSTLKMVGADFKVIHYEDMIEDQHKVIGDLLFDIIGEPIDSEELIDLTEVIEDKIEDSTDS